MSRDILLFLSAASELLTFVSCTKGNAVPISTTWAFNGMAFKTAITVYDSGGSALSLLSAVDSLGNGIAIEFNSHPRINGTYMPTYYYFGTGFPTNNCMLSVLKIPLPTYYSTGKQGDTINLTISGGKLQATFSNITIGNGTDTTTVSGTIVQTKYE